MDILVVCSGHGTVERSFMGTASRSMWPRKVCITYQAVHPVQREDQVAFVNSARAHSRNIHNRTLVFHYLFCF